MVAEFADGGRTMGAPDEQFVVVAAWGKEIAVERPFQSTNFLGVAFVLGDDILTAFPDIPHMNASISGTRGQKRVVPSHWANSGVVAKILRNSAVFNDIPNLDGSSAGADRNLRAAVIPIQTRNRIRGELAEFNNSVVIGVPEVEAGIEGNREDVLGRPLEEVEVEIVLKIWGV